MNEEVVEVDDDSDIEVTFESAPVPKPLPPRFAFPPYHHPVRQVKRQRHSFNPKPCSFCRREFRDKVTVARHTVSHQITKRTFENKTPEICSHLVFSGASPLAGRARAKLWPGPEEEDELL